MRSARIQITEWARSFGGEHFTGTITWEDSDHEYRSEQLEYVLDKRQALALNKKDGVALYIPGESISNRYFSKEELIRDAVEFCKTNEIEFLSEHSSLQPSPIIYMKDRELWSRLQPIGEAFEALYDETDDPWSTFPAQAKKLEEKWDTLLGL
jgi:hypothetical protein